MIKWNNRVSVHASVPSEWPTIPQIYINGEFVGGCDILLGSESFKRLVRKWIVCTNLSQVHQSGELESLLEKHDIIPKIPTGSSEPSS